MSIEEIKPAKFWFSSVALARSLGYYAGELGELLKLLLVPQQAFAKACIHWSEIDEDPSAKDMLQGMPAAQTFITAE